MLEHALRQHDPDDADEPPQTQPTAEDLNDIPPARLERHRPLEHVAGTGSKTDNAAAW